MLPLKWFFHNITCIANVTLVCSYLYNTCSFNLNKRSHEESTFLYLENKHVLNLKLYRIFHWLAIVNLCKRFATTVKLNKSQDDKTINTFTKPKTISLPLCSWLSPTKALQRKKHVTDIFAFIYITCKQKLITIGPTMHIPKV